MINLDYRKNGIGGSELAAMLGLSEYKTPLDVYLEKTGQSAPFLGNKNTERGNMQEPILAHYFGLELEMLNTESEIYKVVTVSELFELYPNFVFPSGAKRTFCIKKGTKVLQGKAAFNYVKPYPINKLIEGTDTIKSSEFSYMYCSPDRLVIVVHFHEIGGVWTDTGNVEILGAELKTCYDRSIKDIEDVCDKQLSWLFQAQYCMQITGLKSWYIAWVHDWNMEVFYCKVDFSKKIADDITAKVTDFWVNHVLAGVEPDPETYEDCMLLYTNPTDDPPLEATPQLLAVIQEYESYKAEERIAAAKAEALKDRIACAVGNSTLINFDGKKIATYKMQLTNRLDTQLLKSEMPEVFGQYCKVSRSRVFRFTKTKQEK